MKKIIASAVALVTMSFAVTAQQIDRSIQPKPGPSPKIKLGKAQKFTLSNGLKVIMVENHKLPRVSASLTIDNPPLIEGNKVGVSELMGDLLGSGTSKISKDNFNERIDYLGASIFYKSNGAYASSLTKYFTEILELMAKGVKDPLFTKEEFDKAVERTLEGIKSNEKNVKAIARRVENALVYGKNHPYGEFITKESINQITLENVKNNYTTYYKPNNAYLVIVGDIDTKKTKKLVEKYFDSWKKGVIPSSKTSKPKNVSATEINFIDMPNAVQSEVSVINSIDLTLGDKDYYAALLANNILGGGGTARLFMNLREDKGYTYGAYSNISQDKLEGAGTFKASAAVRNVVTDSAVVEIQKEINKIRYKKASKEELKNSKAKYIGNFVRNVQKPKTIARFALNIAKYNLPDNFYEDYLKNINAVTLEEVQNAALKYFKGDNARIIITGKGLDVLKNLEKNSDYTINYYNKYGEPTSKPAMKKEIPAGVTKESILNKYFDALGGVNKIKSLYSTFTTYEGEAAGNKIKNIEKRTASNYENSLGMNDNIMMRMIMNKESVKINGQPLPTDMATEMTFSLGVFPEIGYLKDENTKLTGIESVNGQEAYVISRKGKIISWSSYYDSKSGLKIKEIQTTNMGGTAQNQETVYSDYKQFNGVLFPSKKTGNLGPQSINLTLIDAKVNEGVSDADFK